MPLSALLGASTDQLLAINRDEREKLAGLPAQQCDYVVGIVVNQVRAEFPDANGRLLMGFAAALQGLAIRLEENGQEVTARRLLSVGMFAAEQINRELER